MNNDLLLGLSAKIERLYNKMIASEVKSKNNYEDLKCNISSLRDEIEKTNSILEKIYLEIKK